MVRGVRAAAVFVGVTLCCITTGCAGLACAGAAEYSPYVGLDLQPWFTSHPDSTVTVCFDSVCQTVDGPTTGADIHIELADTDFAHPEGEYVLNTAVTQAGQTPVRTSARVHLVKYVQDGPCGSLKQWRLTGSMTADGTLAFAS